MPPIGMGAGCESQICRSQQAEQLAKELQIARAKTLAKYGTKGGEQSDICPGEYAWKKV